MYVDLSLDFEFTQGTLEQTQVAQVLIVVLGLPYDSRLQNDAWVIVIYHSAIDCASSKNRDIHHFVLTFVQDVV